MKEIEVAKWLNAGSKSKGSQLPGRTKTYTGRALSDSADGKVSVDMGGDSVTADNDQGVEIPCGPQVKEGDRVVITTVNGSPYVSSVDGWGDYVGGQAAFSYAYVGELTAREITADMIDASAAYIGTLEAGDISAESISAAKGLFDSIEAGDITANSISAASAYVTNLVAESITADMLSATTAYIATLTAGSITADMIRATTGYISTLTANNITTDKLRATTGYIDDLTSHNITTNKLTATIGYIDDLTSHNITTDLLTATTGYIHDLTSHNITTDNLVADHAVVNTLENNYAHITNGVIDSATIGYAQVNELSNNYAQINLANVNNSWMQNGTIKNAAITDAQILGVSANKLTAGTIDASNINVANLKADNLIVRKVNGQPVLGGFAIVSKNSVDYIDKNPTEEEWYEYVNGSYILSSDVEVDLDKTYYTKTAVVSLYDQEYINNLETDLNDRIDGAIETFTGTVIPTTATYPYTDWYDPEADPPIDTRASHIGDIYYVINPVSDSDGFCYRFAYDNASSQYRWVLIKDSDVTAALRDIDDLKTFETTTTQWIDETDEGLSTTIVRTTDLEDVLGVYKLNNEVRSHVVDTVDEHSSSITTMTSSIASKADASTVSTLSQTVNTVSQTATSNQSKITNLVDVIGSDELGPGETSVLSQISSLDQDLDGFKTTVANTYATAARVSQAESQISQNTNQIALRVTESRAAGYSQPNLSPFFSATPYVNGSYWQNIRNTDAGLVVTEKGDGWARIQLNYVKTDGTPQYVQHRPKSISRLTPDSWYTLLLEFRNVNNTGDVYLRCPDNGQAKSSPDVLNIETGSTSRDTHPVNGGKYHVLFKTNPSTADNYDVFFGCCTRSDQGSTTDYEVRISLYECVLKQNGDPEPYLGSYKPYVGSELYTSHAELDIATDAISSTVNETISNARNGYTVLWDSNQGTEYSGGEAKFQKLDPLTNQVSNEPGFVMWKGIVRTVPNTEFNPGTLIPYNNVIYLVLRLSSASSTTGTLYPVWYKDGAWKNLSTMTSASGTVSNWTWDSDRDITLASCIEPSSEGQFSDCIVYEPPLEVKQVTTANPVAVNAYTKVIQTATDITTIISATTVDNRNLIAYNPDPVTRLKPYLLDYISTGWAANMRVLTNNSNFYYGSGVVNYPAGAAAGEGTTRYMMLCPRQPNSFRPGDKINFEGRVVNWDYATETAFRFTIWFYPDLTSSSIATNYTAVTLSAGHNDVSAQITIPTDADMTNRKYYVIGFYSVSGNTVRLGIPASAICYKLDDYSQTTRSTANTANTTANNLATMVRQYSDGILVCRPGNTVGALVNSDGSFDVVKVTWSGSTPTASTVYSSFGSAITLGDSSGQHISISGTEIGLYDTAAKKRARITAANGLDMYASNGTTNIANFSSTIRLGQSSKYYTKVSDANIEFIDGSASETMMNLATVVNSWDPPTSNVTALTRMVRNTLNLNSKKSLRVYGAYDTWTTKSSSGTTTSTQAYGGLENSSNHGYYIDDSGNLWARTKLSVQDNAIPTGTYKYLDSGAIFSVYDDVTQVFAASSSQSFVRGNFKIINTANIYRSSHTAPTSTVAGSALVFYERNSTSNRVGYIRCEETTSKGIELVLTPATQGPSSEVTNALRLGVNTDGTRYVSVTDAAVWRSGIGAAAASAITKSRITSVDDAIELYTSANKADVSVDIYKVGNLMMSMRISFKLNVDIPSGTDKTILTLKSGFRPRANMYLNANMASTFNSWVTSNGVLHVKPTATISSGTTLFFTATWVLY